MSMKSDKEMRACSQAMPLRTLCVWKFGGRGEWRVSGGRKGEGRRGKGNGYPFPLLGYFKN